MQPKFDFDDCQFFDIENYLSNKGIPYEMEGKNISPGWVGLSCIFCGDTSTHLGIDLDTKMVTCWICGNHTLFDFIKEVEQCDGHDAVEIIKEYIDYTKVPKKKRTRLVVLELLIPEPEPEYNDQMLAYLRRRGYRDEIVEKYDLFPTGRFGDITIHGTDGQFSVHSFRFRIIIPVYINRRMVTYTARDWTGESELRYRHFPGIPIKDNLYNIDSVKDVMMICEGPADVWKLGDGAVATFGMKVTNKQILSIAKKKPRRIRIVPDSEPKAIEEAKRVAMRIIAFIKDVDIISSARRFSPGDLTEMEAQAIRSIVYD